MADSRDPASSRLKAGNSPSSPIDDTPDLRIGSSYDGIDRITVQVDGEIDITSVDQLRHALDTAAAKGAHQLLVDLRAVTFLGSEGLHCLARAAHTAQANGCHLYTIATQRVVVRPIEITGFTQSLRLCADPTDVPAPTLDD